MDYWLERMVEAQNEFTNMSIQQTEKAIKKQYRIALKGVMRDFVDTYEKVLKAGDNPTPADLYKLDKYWQLQNTLSKILQELGDKEVKEYTLQFSRQYEGIWKIISLPTDTAFGLADMPKAEQIINQIWCADGMSWSQRVWKNTEMLKQELNDKLVECMLAGRKTTQLKQELIDVFGVSYNRANTLVRTEMAHIQTQTAQARYKDYGIQEVEVLAEDAGCKHCQALDGQKFSIMGQMPIPAHPNCRCCIVPVIDIDV